MVNVHPRWVWGLALLTLALLIMIVPLPGLIPAGLVIAIFALLVTP